MDMIDVNGVTERMQERIASYREYEYCDQFLDEMREGAHDVIERLLMGGLSSDAAVELFAFYLYCMCTGIESSEGHVEDVIWPRYATDPAEVADVVRNIREEQDAYMQDVANDFADVLWNDGELDKEAR